MDKKEEVKEKLKSLGHTKEDIEKIIKSFAISKMKPETLLKNITRNYNFLLDFGYKKDAILHMTKIWPQIYTYSVENMKEKIKFIQSLGYSEK